MAKQRTVRHRSAVVKRDAPAFRFLDLPPELRVAVYSYLVPPVLNDDPCNTEDPAPYSLRLTCRLVKAEFDCEVETAMTEYVERMIRATDLPGFPQVRAKTMRTFTRHLQLELPISFIIGAFPPADHFETTEQHKSTGGFWDILSDTIPHFRRVSFEIYRDDNYVRGHDGMVKFVQALDYALGFLWDAFREPHYPWSHMPGYRPHGFDQASLSWQGLLSSAERKTFEHEGRFHNGWNWLRASSDPNRFNAKLKIDSREVCLTSAHSTFVHGKMWEMKAPLEAPLDDSDDE